MKTSLDWAHEQQDFYGHHGLTADSPSQIFPAFNVDSKQTSPSGVACLVQSPSAFLRYSLNIPELNLVLDGNASPPSQRSGLKDVKRMAHVTDVTVV
jgi:hypothetical protein